MSKTATDVKSNHPTSLMSSWLSPLLCANIYLLIMVAMNGGHAVRNSPCARCTNYCVCILIQLEMVAVGISWG